MDIKTRTIHSLFLGKKICSLTEFFFFLTVIASHDYFTICFTEVTVQIGTRGFMDTFVPISWREFAHPLNKVQMAQKPKYDVMDVVWRNYNQQTSSGCQCHMPSVLWPVLTSHHWADKSAFISWHMTGRCQVSQWL